MARRAPRSSLLAPMSNHKAETKPLPGGSEPGTSVVVEPLLGGSILAPPQFFESDAKRLRTLRMLGIGTPKSKRWLVPIPAYLITHPTAGPILIRARSPMLRMHGGGPRTRAGGGRK